MWTVSDSTDGVHNREVLLYLFRDSSYEKNRRYSLIILQSCWEKQLDRERFSQHLPYFSCSDEATLGSNLAQRLNDEVSCITQNSVVFIAFISSTPGLSECKRMVSPVDIGSRSRALIIYWSYYRTFLASPYLAAVTICTLAWVKSRRGN